MKTNECESFSGAIMILTLNQDVMKEGTGLYPI